MKRFFYGLLFLLATMFAIPVLAAMTSTHYSINWDDFNQGGGETSTSTNYATRDTVGDVWAGTSTSANYNLSAGYRAGADSPTLTFVVKSEDESSSQNYSSFDRAGKTVAVSSTGDLAIGDYLALVENRGFSQKAVVGKIIDISGETVSVDGWDGAGGLSVSPSGGDDHAFRMNAAAVAFGTVSQQVENTSMTMASVQSAAPNGYTVYMRADQLLQKNPAESITTVTDGAVTAGSEEYGASTTGTRAYLPDTDLGVTTTQRIIQTRGTISSSPADRTLVTYKLSITGATAPGVYSQNIFYTLTANF